MNSIILRFKIVIYNEVVEVVFDKRLSFIANFKLLRDIYDIGNIEDKFIYDESKNIALRKDVSLSNYNFYNFLTLSIY